MYNHFIAVSQSTKEELVKRFGIEPGRIAVVPNGIDVEKYRQSKRF